MKRLISAAAAVMIVLTMAGCSNGNTDDKEKKSPTESTAENKADNKSGNENTNGGTDNVQDLPEIEPA